MYCIAICDDNKDDIDELKEMIVRDISFKKDIIFLEFYSGEELLDNLPLDADVLFLDIQMQGLNGDQVAVKVKQSKFKGLLVQCSGIYAPTPETIVISPYRYLQKQDPREKTIKVLEEILEEMESRKNSYVLLAEYGEEKTAVYLNDILYISRHRKGSELYLDNGVQPGNKEPMICTTPFDELRDRLAEKGFAYPHNSYIVNLQYLVSIARDEQTIRVGNTILTLSRSKKKAFIEQFIDYLNQKYRGDMNGF